MPIDPHEQLAIFLRDIKDNLVDDTPRLVLADWLQDQGDPRGELLALDLQQHALFETDPQWPVLWQRRQAVLRQHAFDWLGPLIDLV